MVPPTLLQQLSRLRARERWLRLAWGITLALTVFTVVMAALCLADWRIDLKQDTPYALRQAMLAGQVVFWSVGVIGVICWACWRRLHDDALALWVEERVPEFGHRLISALQLNRPGAATQGMSPAMIDAVTREAEEQSARHHFAGLAEHRRLRWCGRVLVPLVAVVALVGVIWPDTVMTLVARQFLSEREIQRSLRLESVTAPVWPSSEEVVLRFRAQGQGIEATRGQLRGKVRIEPEDGGPSLEYPLQMQEAGADWGTYGVRIPATTVNFSYRAWLEDGRTRRPLRIQLEPRPAIVQLDAYVRLPAYTGLRPDGNPFEVQQPRGDVAGVSGTTARVAIVTQKPIKKATLELLGRPTSKFGLPAPEKPVGPTPVQPGPMSVAPGLETVLRRIDMTLREGGRAAEGIFHLRPSEAGQPAPSVYRIVVEDEYGFVNLDAPRRSIHVLADEPPLVAFLPERFAEPGRPATEADEVEGVPVLFQGNFRVAYRCSSPYGLGKAQFRYRINQGNWWTLPLKERAATEQTGPFDPRRGSFVRSSFFDEVEFHPMPSLDPERFPAGTEGGGRFDFKTRALPDLKVGDTMEFYVEVFDRNQDPRRLPGRSDVRQKTVVNAEQYLAWKDQVLQQEGRIRQLESRQRLVFADSDPSPKPVSPVGRGAGGTGTRRDSAVSSFARCWQIIGPFPSPEEKGLDVAYPPEKEKIDLDKDYTGIKAVVRWRTHYSLTDRIDLEKLLGHGEAGVAYAVCWVRGTTATAVLATGSDDGIKVWINRKEVLARRARREAVAREDQTPVNLPANAWQELLVKVDNRAGSWAFFLEFLDPRTDKPLEGLTFRAAPPEEEDGDKRCVRSWLLIGPFPNGPAGRDKVFPPETDKVDAGKEYDGIDSKVRWKPYTSDADRIALDRFFARPGNEANIAYAVCWVRCDDRDKAILATGSDDGLKVWINRKLVLNRASAREARPEDAEPVVLQKGWNEILVKVDNRLGRWAFLLQLLDPRTERPLAGLEFRTTPPE